MRSLCRRSTDLVVELNNDHILELRTVVSGLHPYQRSTATQNNTCSMNDIHSDNESVDTDWTEHEQSTYTSDSDTSSGRGAKTIRGILAQKRYQLPSAVRSNQRKSSKHKKVTGLEEINGRWEHVGLLEQTSAMKNDGKRHVNRNGKSAEASVTSDDEQRRASVAKITRVSSILTVLVSGLALFSDGKLGLNTC